MAGTRIPNPAAPDSAASSSMGPSFYNASAQSLYSDVYQELRKVLDSYGNMNTRSHQQQQQHSNIGPPSSSPVTDFSNILSSSKQNNLSYGNQGPQYEFPKANGITHNFVNQINPTGDGNQITMDNDSTIAPTIQFDLGSNLLNCSSQQSSLVDFSSPFSYAGNAPGIGMAQGNQTCFSNDSSSLASTIWNMGPNMGSNMGSNMGPNMSNGFGSSPQGNLSSGNMGNDSTVDYTARWDVGSSLDSSSASQPSLSSNGNNLLTQAAPPNVPDEMRLRPFISEPPKAVEHRIGQALDNRLYVIDKKLVGDPQSPTGCDYQVLGSTGNIYTVRLATIPSCSCPDPQHTCTHILFIMLRVLKLPDHDPRIWQTALLSTEVRDLLRNARVNDTAGLANQQVRQWYQDMSTSQVGDAGNGEIPAAGLQNLQREVSGDCPVCFETMDNQDGMPKEELSFCKVCGNNVHKDCFTRWSLSRQEAGERVTCIFCRSLWVEDNNVNSSLKKRKAEPEIGADGFVNLVDYATDTRADDISIDRMYPQSRPKYMREWRAY